MVMESLQRLDPPQALGKLTLLARLGEGGMATVYVAAMGRGPLARMCAVKLLRADVADPDYRRRFLDEATLVVRLHHNNVVDVREAGELAGQLFIVMELCEGRDLADLWDRCATIGRAFPVPLSVYLVREALRGLHYAHTFGGLSLVHRDISPSNLLIDWAGAVRVADFGLATSVLKATATMPGMVFGKVGYMAPEQATRRELDGRTDVYSCGVVLWELLTGRPLREAGLDTNAVAGFSAVRPSTLSRRVDPALDDLVMNALAADPQDRFADAAAFMRALSEWLGRNAPTTDQESLAEFMRGLFPDAQVRDHAAYGELLAGVAGPTTDVFRRGDTDRPTRDVLPVLQLEDLTIGMVVGERYRIESELGRGGMGTVYLAEHVTVGRKVAVKVLTREWSGHQTVARRFREEARAASAVGHPNIVEVFDAGTLPDGRLYLVMEHLQGRTLYDELCATGPLPIDRAVTVVREIARGIMAAHAVGIIHRDLKPDNVMLVPRGAETAIKLLDFGIAASADRGADDRLTQPGHTLGTPEYMAPEQAKGRDPTQSVDIYALGAMLFEMLVGEPPFVGENYVEVLTRKMTEPAPRLETLRADLPPALVALCQACLEIDPARRPVSVAALLAALDGADSTALVPIDVPAQTRVDGLVVLRAPRRAAAPRSGRPWFLGASALLGLAVVILVGLGVWRLGTSADEPIAVSDPRVVEPEIVAASVEPPIADAKPRLDPVVPGGPEPTTVDPKPQALEPLASESLAPEPLGVERVEPAVVGVPAPALAPSSPESPACREHRRAAEAAKYAGDWSAVLANVGRKACWAGSYRQLAVTLRVKALFEAGRFADCAKAGAKASDLEAREIAVGCAVRLRDG